MYNQSTIIEDKTANIKNQILTKLKTIEQDHNVTILLAIESGSRAWGFPSEDSDYDVRFIYVHKPHWYLSIFKKRDVIEIPVDPVLDINGWDLKKALKLLRKSNPALMEWLTSPMVYLVNEPLLAPLKQLAKTAFIPESSCHHYLSMAKANIAKAEKSDQVRIKTYLYAIRPILCCRWVIDNDTQPPMLFHDVLNIYLPDGEVRAEIDKLLEIKTSSAESDTVNRLPNIETWLENQIQELEEKIPKSPKVIEIEKFDNAFRQILEMIEG